MAAMEPVAAQEPPPHANQPVHGWLSKKGGLRWQKRFFVLDGIALRYYLSEEDWAGEVH